MGEPKNGERTSRWKLRLTSEERKAIRQSLFGHGFQSAHNFRFWLLLTLSVIIAVMGLTLGSTAVVIGAMLIAPLMEPILATSYAITVGSFRLTWRTAAKVVVASLLGFLLSAGLSSLIPGDTLTEEVLARTAPDLRDLVVAMAAGIAGAYATAKQDGATALPGVAVAVALVPPLATIGVAFEAGRYGLAQGAALLYVTNLLAITACGVGVFLLLGISPSRSDAARQRWSRLGSGIAGVVVVLVAVILYNQTSIIAARNNDRVTARADVEAWLAAGDSRLEVDQVKIEDGIVMVDLSGSDSYPPLDQLAADLTADLGELEVRVRVAQRSEASTTDAPTPNEAAKAKIEALARTWILEAPRDRIAAVTVADDSAIVEVEGPDTPPPVEVLAVSAADAGYDVPIEVRWTQQRTLSQSELQLQAKRDQIRELAAAWALDIDKDLSVVDVQLEDSIALIDLAGPAIDADPKTLEKQIKDVLDEEIEVDMRLTLRIDVVAATTTTTTTQP